MGDRVRGALAGPQLERLNRALGAIQVGVLDQDPDAAVGGALRVRNLVAALEAPLAR